MLIGLAYVQSRSNTAFATLSGPFDGERAFADLQRLVAFGPRPSGSAALQQTREWITNRLRAAGIPVSDDSFIVTMPVGPVGNH